MMIAALLTFTIAANSNADSLFQNDTAIDVTLRGPISTLIENKSDRDEYRFDLIVGDTTIALEVRARGNSRLRVCKFPPLRFKFPADTDEQSVFAGQDELKVVTHCNEKTKDAGNVYGEFLAYRIFSLLSESSYRVRPLRITYVDTDGRMDLDSPQHAFVLESNAALAARIGGKPADLPGVLYSRLDDAQATLIYVFQYLIGNTDWSLVVADTNEFCCHNGDLFELDDKLVMVPYDFDLAGLVNASYARPDNSLGIKSVRTRRYRGYCTSADTVRSALRAIKDHRSEILELATKVPAISDKALQVRLDYLTDFFEQSEDEDKLMKSFERRCL